MAFLQRARCPYCGKKINPVLGWTVKREGEYRCTACGGISNIVLESSVYIIGIAAVAVAVLVFFIGNLVLKHTTLPIVVGVLLPFFLFFILSLFTIRLERPVIRQKPSHLGTNTQRIPRQDSGEWTGSVRTTAGAEQEAIESTRRIEIPEGYSAQNRPEGARSALVERGRQNQVIDEAFRSPEGRSFAVNPYQTADDEDGE